MGTLEEKELLFRAFIEQDEFFEYKKRATKDKPSEIIQESIYDRAARLCKNAKSRQDKQREKSVTKIAEIAKSLPSDNKITILDATECLPPGLSGVVAIKIAEMFNKPCVLLNKFTDETTGKISFGGSARNIDNSPIESFKDIINQTTSFSYAVGHASAFGVGIDIDKVDDAIKEINNILKDVEYDSVYKVDFILDVDDMSVGLVVELSKLEDFFGQGIPEPEVAIENITLSRKDFEIFGKNEDTISFFANGIKYVQFKCKEGNPLYGFLQDAWDENECVTFNIVGKPSINEYNGIRTAQIVVDDVDVLEIGDTLEEIEW